MTPLQARLSSELLTPHPLIIGIGEILLLCVLIVTFAIAAAVYKRVRYASDINTDNLGAKAKATLSVARNRLSDSTPNDDDQD